MVTSVTPPKAATPTDGGSTSKGKIEDFVENLTSRWKREALQAVLGFLKPKINLEDQFHSISRAQLHELQTNLAKMREIAQAKHDKLTPLITKFRRLQAVFPEQETKVILLETTYGMRVKTKELEELSRILLVKDDVAPTADTDLTDVPNC
ncbi:hypothetical protein R1sor_016176 [Riccia sorocarpa]|uniref:Uncharacterized protein n=1 Tax=Riccia sorocarpa TaxID=122646 RepID=A0ABD3HEA0_9MARC